MPRDQLRDDYDDQPRRPRTNPGWIVALVVGGAFAAGCVACAGIGLLGFWAGAVQVAQGPAVAVVVKDEAGAAGAAADEKDGMRRATPATSSAGSSWARRGTS